MSMIDPTARIEDGAVIGEGTTIGPYCIIGPRVVIGADCKLVAHVYVAGQTTIGDGCTIREQSTMSAGTVAGGGVTRVGDRGYFMNCSHIGHDCVVGNDVIFATSATLGGHAEIGDFVFIGGLSAVHQFTRVGAQVMVGALTGVRGDVIPFALASGHYAALTGLNTVGLKRRKFTRERLAVVRSFYQKLFHGSGVFADRLNEVRHLAAADPAIAEILTFIDAAKHRELCQPVKDGKRS